MSGWAAGWVIMAATGIASAAVAGLAVEGVRRYAYRSGLLDVPNERSSHEVPTPRGGGVGFLVPVVLAMVLTPVVGAPPALAYLGGTAVVLTAVVGWMDDRHSMPVAPRLGVHVAAALFIASLTLVWDSSGLVLVSSGIAAAGIWAFWTVSVINVVNFMDGTDGLIGLQAAVYGAFGACVLGPSGAGLFASVLAGAAVGFLVLNWDPARIFMGDVGSGALGVVMVLVGLLTVLEADWSVVHAFLPLMPLFVDETLTMVRRVRNGERAWEAHRSHVYQRLVQQGWSHGRVAILYGAASVLCAVVSIALPEVALSFLITAGATFLGLLTGALALRGWVEREGFPV